MADVVIPPPTDASDIPQTIGLTERQVNNETSRDEQSDINSDKKSLKSVTSSKSTRLSSEKKWNSSPAQNNLFQKNDSKSTRTSSAKSKRSLSCKSAKLSRVMLSRGGVDSESQNELMKNILITQFDRYTSYDDNDDEDDNEIPNNSDEDDDDNDVFGYSQQLSHQDDDEDYDTDLEVDIDTWLNDERGYSSGDYTGEKKYLSSCDVAGVVPASYFVRHISENDICMRFHGLGPQGVKAMCVPLKTNSKIEKLDLEGNDMEELGCVSLSDMLKENIYITKLVLSNNRIGNDGIITLCEIFRKNDSVTSLDISGNELTDVSAYHITEMLQKNTSLKHLYLSHNSFEERGAEDFYEALSQNEALETLDLSWNRFRTKGAICIAEGIQENYGLKCINLCMNGFGADGASAMGKALKVNRTLQDLDLCFNRIPDSGVEDIGIGLQTNDVLKSLKIGSNPFGGDSALFLLKSLDKNDSSALKYLEMLNIEVTAEFIDLKILLEADRSMKIIHGGLVYDDTYTIPTSWRMDDVDSILDKDPMSILKKYITQAGYRLIDFFKDFDKDSNMYLTKEELTRGLKNANVTITESQFQDLFQRLDKDKDGKIDFGELISSDKEYREQQRKLLQQKIDAEKNLNS